ncbi:MAG: NUDIX hydrolase [Granulosicoccus sp.]|nr:NUDIX hydrolase [Granulosicoccus sp.]
MSSPVPAAWQTHAIDERYDNPWITVSHRRVTAPTGNPATYGLVHFKNTAIAVIPIDRDGHTWLVGQHRYTLDQYAWEIPEGGAPPGESPLGAARRELREETGITARRWTSLLKLYTSNSVTDELARAFVAQDLSFGDTQPDDTEVLALRRVPLDDAIALAMEGRITDGLSVAALLKVRLLLDQGLLSL